MNRDDLIDNKNILQLGLVPLKPGRASGADMWQGMAIWQYKDCNRNSIFFRGPAQNLKVEGHFNSQIRTVGDFIDCIRLLTGCIIPTEFERIK